MVLRKNNFLLLLLLLTNFFAYAYYPEIPKLVSTDPLFKQFCNEVENNYKLLARGDNNIPVLFFTYKPQKDDTLFSIASRASIPYETIATLNHIDSVQEKLLGKTLILPTCSGVFVSENPVTSFEMILKKNCFSLDSNICYTIQEERFIFYPGYRISVTERSFFLDSALCTPLPQGILTSSYGMRLSPITGKFRFHQGIDLAAPLGTDVLACGAGIVEKVGWDDVYGNYVLIKHSKNRSSFYAHLAKTLVTSGLSVRTGTCIGKVGTTGASTGPHLHFEIREKKQQVDPYSVIME